MSPKTECRDAPDRHARHAAALRELSFARQQRTRAEAFGQLTDEPLDLDGSDGHSKGIDL
jgi:hypothetical protein